jgi:hypothetical protein
MIDDILPEPEPAGALVPPPRNPPTALATSDALPPRSERRAISPRDGTLRRLVDTALNTLDSVGDRVAHAIGLR